MKLCSMDRIVPFRHLKKNDEWTSSSPDLNPLFYDFWALKLELIAYSKQQNAESEVELGAMTKTFQPQKTCKRKRTF